MRFRISRTFGRLGSAIVLLALLLALGLPERSQSAPSDELAVLVDGLGKYGRKISTNSPVAQQFFDQGLRLTYGYYFPEAIASFQEALRHDPDQPMIYWGLALAIGPNPNSRFLNFPDDPKGEGAKAIKAARARAAKASKAEQALIESLYAIYDVETYPNRDERDRKFIEATRLAFRNHPDDLESGFLFADAYMIHARWSYWRRDGSPLPGTLDAARALEHVMSRDPDHPGAVHLYIHLYESSASPERALPQADRLESIMPRAGHVVHMPSHIYVRVGQYEKAVSSNQRSLEADRVLLSAWGERKLPAFGTYGMSHRTHSRHAWDFMRYASLLQGNYKRAIEAARAADAGQSHQGAGGAHRMHTTVWLVHKVFGKWDALLAEPAPAPGSAYVDGLWSYVRGSAFVGKGEIDKAQLELERLRIAARDPAMKDLLALANPAPTILELATHGLEGEIAMSRRQYRKAVESFAAAVRLQDTLNYVEPPDWGQSMRLYLGAALLKAGRPREAEKVYREDLREFRENGWALFGLGQSLSAQGKTGAAKAVRLRFDQAWKGADVTLNASIF